MVALAEPLTPNLTPRDRTGSLPGTSRASPAVEATRLLDMLAGAWVSQALYVVAELAIADLLAGGPKTAAELADATGADPGALSRVLRALATLGVFSIDPAGRCAHTPVSRYLQSDRPDSLRPLARMRGTGWFWGTWGRSCTACRRGGPRFAGRTAPPFSSTSPGTPRRRSSSTTP